MENNAMQRNSDSVPQAPYPQITRRRRIPQAPPPLHSRPFNTIPQAPPLNPFHFLPLNLSHVNEPTQKSILTTQINDTQLETTALIDDADLMRNHVNNYDEITAEHRSSLKRRYQDFIRHCNRASNRKTKDKFSKR